MLKELNDSPYFKHCIGTTSGVGTNRWLKYTLEQIPMAAVNKDLEKLVDDMNKQPCVDMDLQIDYKVCDLYNLDEKEKELIIGQ